MRRSDGYTLSMFNPAWLSLVLAAGAQSGLMAAAQLAPRPAACVDVSGPWQRAGHPTLPKHCAALARGYSLLADAPSQALELARGLRQGQLATDALVLEARALVALGQHELALKLFVEAQGQGARAVAGAGAQHDHAVAASFAGDAATAAGLYRGLVPQIGLLKPRRRARVLLEAALAVMRLGPEHVEEARGLIDYADRIREYREARGPWLMLRALAELRAGSRSEVSVQDPDAEMAALLGRSFNSSLPAVPAAEVAAMGASVLAASDPVRARQLWAQFAADELSSPWRQWLASTLGSRR